MIYGFFLTIIFLIIVVWIYAKWHILGPKWSAFINRRKKWFLGLFDRSKPKVQKGAVIENPTVSEELEKKEQESVLAQDLLTVQTEKDKQKREVEKMQADLDAKVQSKQEKKENKQKQKATAKEEKRRYKEEKSKYKAEEKAKKESNTSKTKKKKVVSKNESNKSSDTSSNNNVQEENIDIDIDI